MHFVRVLPGYVSFGRVPLCNLYVFYLAMQAFGRYPFALCALCTWLYQPREGVLVPNSTFRIPYKISFGS